MNYRKLRIAWSVAWGAVAVLLCVLWVGSYWSTIAWPVGVTSTHRYYIHSLSGTFALECRERIFRTKELTLEQDVEQLKAISPITIRRIGSFDSVSIAYWLLIPLVSIVAAGPWLPYRFSLRTLLIATTLVAVALGLIIFAARG